MTRHIIKKTCGIALLLIVAANGLFAQKSAVADETKIRKVIENFRTSLIKKDKPLLLSLFSEGIIGWQSVTEDASLARVRAKNPKSVKILTTDSHLLFADFIANDKKRTEETFANIKISTDGDVASVGFDYVFLYDNRENNRGQEHWLLVRGENGWKIASVVWSEKLPPPVESK